jgi:UDP-GlcNAc:undecaprenyl-phosphate/decaprenyl-phosphate GlcNAc-1-phosphate transferase
MLATFLASYVVVLAATPVAIRVARRTGFLDHPVGYKRHARPTPYLGGAAVFAGFLAGAAAYGAILDSSYWPIFAGAGLLWMAGTIDDRIALGPRIRVLAEVAAAFLLWEGGLGWSLFPGDVADLAVTVLWVVGIVNAFNLTDNLDGAAGTVAGISGAGIALLAAIEGPEALAALAVAISGACVGFLHFNLQRPARVFLGDGGSMLLGFLVAALAMAVWRVNDMVGPALLPTIMLAGLPVLDMTLVIVSRIRRGVSIAAGGRDHITHRLLPKLGAPWLVALTLAIVQAALCAVAIEMLSWEPGAMLAGAGVAFLLGALTIVMLETPFFRPEWVDWGPAQLSASGSGEPQAAGSGSTSLSPGATAGRSIPSTELGP